MTGVDIDSSMVQQQEDLNNLVLDNRGHDEWAGHKDMWWRILYTTFFITAFGYLMARRSSDTKFHLIKPVPVVILGYIVLLWCSIHSHSSLFHLLIPHNPTSYAIYISAGLFLSAIGDFCLIYKRFFVHGVLFFLAAHLSFILAFTAESESLSKFFTPVVIVCLVSFNIFFVYMFITKVIPLFIKQTPKSLSIALFFYTSVIVTMCYTASVKAISNIDFSNPEQLFVNWNRLFSSLALYALIGALGAILFFISDLMILCREINALSKNQVSLIRKFIGDGDVGMITYWLGQLCIALSVSASAL
ncbi:hypothetical protein CYY_002023 [Polysphondylium violaceum]|uniref:Transmembrane protein n=1 Tax=Polysphondylium violaceum TaxID=133409 RepID=A0A8J4PXE3_9MYCE|nr:hypothetical protein CYY_002023 [Polysphondylium violaceum]